MIFSALITCIELMQPCNLPKQPMEMILSADNEKDCIEQSLRLLGEYSEYKPNYIVECTEWSINK